VIGEKIGKQDRMIDLLMKSRRVISIPFTPWPKRQEAVFFEHTNKMWADISLSRLMKNGYNTP
jgi:hypothetical protein